MSRDSVPVLESDVEHKEQLQEPEKYKVMIFNDDYTTKDFVVEVLKDIFKKTHESAVLLMESVHNAGKACAGIYVYDIAETKRVQVMQVARANGFPLKSGLEKN